MRKSDLLELWRILGDGIRCGAEEITVIAHEERWHHGIEVDDAQYAALLIKHHIVDLGIAVAYMLLQLAFAEEALAEAHLVHIAFDFCNEILHAFCASGTVFLHCLTELVAAQFHVVEIRDGFAEAVGDVGELSLELSEGLACVVGAFWVYCLLGDGTRNEDGNAPVLLVFVLDIGLAIAAS